MFITSCFIRKWNKPNSEYHLLINGKLKCVKCDEWLPISRFRKVII